MKVEFDCEAKEVWIGEYKVEKKEFKEMLEKLLEYDKWMDIPCRGCLKHNQCKVDRNLKVRGVKFDDPTTTTNEGDEDESA